MKILTIEPEVARREVLDCLQALGAVAKNREAVASKLHALLYVPLVRFFRKHRLPRHEAEELTTDVFVNIFRSAWQFQGDSPEKACNWVGTTARNIFIDHYRKARSKREKGEEVSVEDLRPVGSEDMWPTGDLMDQFPGRDTTVETLKRKIAEGTCLKCVARVLKELVGKDPDGWTALWGYVMDDWGYEEVMRLRRCTNGAARQFMWSVKEKFYPKVAEKCQEKCRHLIEELRHE